jgi:hypothetical protein
VVPASFTPYFTAIATAAAALIGLLFVAVSLRPETVFGESATAPGRANAGSAFTALVNCFFVSVVALIPQAGVGDVSITLAIISIFATVQLHREVGRKHLQLGMLLYGLIACVFQFVNGVLCVLNPHDLTYVQVAAYVMIGQISGALSRAWSLVEGRHIAAAADGATAAAADSAAARGGPSAP